jgi:PmbA protein
MDLDRIEEMVSKVFREYELFLLKERLKKYEGRERKVYGVEFKEEAGLALRGFRDNRMVFAYTYDMDEQGISSLLENAEAILPFLEEDRDGGFAQGYPAYPLLDIYDGQGLKVGDEKKTSLLAEMEGTILDYDRRIVATRNCELHEHEIEVAVVNSRGLKAEGRKTLYTLFGLCVAKQTDEVSWYDWSWAHSFEGLDGKKLGAGIAGKTISLLSGEQIGTGVYDGILTPQASSDMLSILADSFLSESHYKNKTKLKDRVGVKCFSDVITILDSGIAGMGSFPFDGEGVPSKETVLVKDGFFESFLYDVYYARKFGKVSTGNGVREGIKESPVCGPRGLYVEKGVRDLGKNLTNGIIIEELMGTHTANSITGDFSLGAVGYLCRDGRRSPFQGVIFSGNVFELMNNVKEVGSDLKFYGVTGSPSLFVEGMKISGK